MAWLAFAREGRADKWCSSSPDGPAATAQRGTSRQRSNQTPSA